MVRLTGLRAQTRSSVPVLTDSTNCAPTPPPKPRPHHDHHAPRHPRLRQVGACAGSNMDQLRTRRARHDGYPPSALWAWVRRPRGHQGDPLPVQRELDAAPQLTRHHPLPAGTSLDRQLDVHPVRTERVDSQHLYVTTDI